MSRNVLVQMLATIFIPTGLYAFYRIDKLRMGGIIYAVIFGGAVGVGITAGLLEGIYNDIAVSGLIITIVAVLSYIIPMLFIRKWTIEYNSRIKILS